jgi:hypothetical protein
MSYCSSDDSYDICMWMRVFGRNRIVPSLTQLVESLHAKNFRVVPMARGDDLGWSECQLSLAGVPIGLARFLTLEDDLREDLNSHAAELESYLDLQPAAQTLMELVIQTQQLITLRKPIGHPNDVAMESCCEAIVQWLVQPLDGVYQIDARGWFNQESELMVTEY